MNRETRFYVHYNFILCSSLTSTEVIPRVVVSSRATFLGVEQFALSVSGMAQRVERTDSQQSAILSAVFGIPVHPINASLSQLAREMAEIDAREWRISS